MHAMHGVKNDVMHTLSAAGHDLRNICVSCPVWTLMPALLYEVMQHAAVEHACCSTRHHAPSSNLVCYCLGHRVSCFGLRNCVEVLKEMLASRRIPVERGDDHVSAGGTAVRGQQDHARCDQKEPWLRG